MELLATYGVEILLGVISCALGIWLKHNYKKQTEQKQKYELLLEEEKTRNIRKMIVDEIEPLAHELHRVKEYADNEVAKVKKSIKKDENEFETRLEDLKDYHNRDRDEFDEKIHDLTKKHEDNLARIIESYKFRFIQLCKTHMRDGYITPDEWDQIVTFYDLYRSLGGNGQAEEYFERVKLLKDKIDSANINQE